MTRLLVSLCLLTLVSGQALPRAEELKQSRELERPSALPPMPANNTASSRDIQITYGAHVEHYKLWDACSGFKDYNLYFFSGFITNSRAYKGGSAASQEQFTSLASLDSWGRVISSTSGAIPKETNTLYSSWEFLQFGPLIEDIRVAPPAKLRLTLINHFPQIYIPLYLKNSLWPGEAYYLHLYPDGNALGNDYTYHMDGLMWGKHDAYNAVFFAEIDVAKLIRDLYNFTAPDWAQSVRSIGEAWYAQDHSSQADFAYPRKNTMYLDGGSVAGSATTFICRSKPLGMNMSWTWFETLLKRQFSWL